jgi:hypothetical protein
MHTVNPEGVTLPSNPEARYDMVVKRKAIARFMFNMAFENSIEEGYVTEKPFDALIAGTVPVYLGDAAHLKRLLPHPKAAIFIADYNGNMQALATYLNYLTRNETAYEEHRAWRKTFSYEENVRNKPLLQKSWYCRVCEWAVAAAARRPPSAGGGNGTADSAAVAAAVAGSAGGKGAAPADHCVLQEKLRRPCAHLDTFAGKPLKSAANGDLFLVENGTIRAIPNADTFAALKVRLCVSHPLFPLVATVFCPHGWTPDLYPNPHPLLSRTLQHCQLDHNDVILASAEEVVKCPRGPPLPPCTNC